MWILVNLWMMIKLINSQDGIHAGGDFVLQSVLDKIQPLAS